MANPAFNSTVQQFTIYALDLTEFLVHFLLACPVSAINFFLILRTTILHPNLKFIVLCQSTCIFFRSIARIMVSGTRIYTGNVLWNDNQKLTSLYGFFGFFRNTIAHVLVFERVMATFYVKNYERSRKPYFSMVWFSIIILLSLANNLSQINSLALVLITWNGLFVMALAEYIIFIWIWKFNDRIFQDKTFAVQHNLSERYQLAENIRTGRAFMPTLLIHLISITFGSLQCWVGNYSLLGPYKDNRFTYALSDICYFCTIAVTNFLIELTMILYHPYLRRNFIAIFSHLKMIILKSLHLHNPPEAGNRVTPSTTGNKKSITNREVAQMNIRGNYATNLAKSKSSTTAAAAVDGTYTEADKYFEQLKKSWE